MTFEELEKFVKEYGVKLEEKFGKYDDKEKLILSSTVKISEEVGELCDEVMTHNSRQRKTKLDEHNSENLPAEFADVILAVFMLAKDMEVDINKALEKKIQKIKTKYDLY